MHRPRCLCILVISVLFLISISQLSHSQESDLEKANNLSQQVFKLCQQGRYVEAIPIAENVLAIREQVLGPEHPDVAMSLNILSSLYFSLGDFAKAESLSKRALKISEKAFGPEHPDVVMSLLNLGAVYFSNGDHGKAESLYKRALAIREKTFGPEHPSVAMSLLNLGAVYFSNGDHGKAESLSKRALKINEKVFGPEHLSVAMSLSNLAEVYTYSGNFAKAESLYKRALAINEKALGPEHPLVTSNLNRLASLYDYIGDFAKAESLYKRALKINEKAFGTEHPSVTPSLTSLANLYVSLVDYDKAEPLYKRALKISEKVFGPEHPSVAPSLTSLAQLYNYIGDYAKAETLYKRALTIEEKTFGPRHIEAGSGLSGLAILYTSLGDYDKAQALCKRALETYEDSFGSEHPSVARSLTILANLYVSLGDYDKAEPLCKRALAIWEKTFGPEHPDVAAILNILAILYTSLGDYDKAKPLYKRVLEINEKAFGTEHYHVALILNNLAELYSSFGDYTRAEPLYKRALAIVEKVLGPQHPHVATILHNLALLYAAKDNFEKANYIFNRVQEIESNLIDQVMGFTSEDQKIKFLSVKKGNLYVFLSLIKRYLSQSPSARRDALDVWLKRKGVILEAHKRFQEALLYSDEPKAVKTFQELARVRARLSKLAFAGPGKESFEAYKRRIANLEERKNRLEARLSQLSQAFALKQKILKADCGKVAGALPGNTVLVEFARVEMFNFKAKGKEEKWNSPHYLAFVLHAGKGGKVGMIDLGDAKDIDKAVARFKKQISIMDEKAIKSSKKIYNLVFKPLKKELGDVKEIFISPDGNLNLIPFEVLQGPDGRYLIEDYTFNYLAAGRDGLGFGQIKEKGKKALLIGDPDFDMETQEKESTLRKLAIDEVKQEVLKRSSDMSRLHFTRLPETREEVKAIQALFGEDKAELYTGKDALEEVLKQRKTPSVLHLATHGFFLSDLGAAAPAPDIMGRAIKLVTSKARIRKGKIENPLLRSGIALAGANNVLKSGDAKESDGIVTAEKILGLRLRGTDMVVLSACETGVGEVKTGEGVFGLRRAFTQAGAKSLVMSMWAVPDKETKELMIEFYKKIISGKMNKCQALRQAALKEMKIVKQRYGHTNPLFWGAFVFMGEP